MSIEIIRSQELYNLMNQVQTGDDRGEGFAQLSDPNFLLLVDARTLVDYEHYHIPTAIRPKVKRDEQFQTLSMILPFEPLIECKQHIVVYDGDTTELTNAPNRPAVRVAKALSRAGAQVPVKVLFGGFQEFSANYPFMRSTKNCYTARELDGFETYPVEIIQGSVYLGSSNQANRLRIRKNLKLDAFVNFSDLGNTKTTPFFRPENDENVIEINTAKKGGLTENDLKPVATFIDKHRLAGNRILISCPSGRGISATMAIYYLIHSSTASNPISKRDAVNYVETCKNDVFVKGPILNGL